MLYSTIILTLATAALAIDIRFHNEAHCKNGWGRACTGVSAGQCCNGARTDGWAAMSYVAIPSNWDIYTRSYSSESCNEKDLIGPIRNEGKTKLCARNNKHYKSGQYFFSNKKTRGVVVERDGVPQDCVKPDTLYFADNSAYHIADLADAQVEELSTFAENGTAPNEIPEVYQALKIE